MLNFVEQSYIFTNMRVKKEKRVPGGLRFPESLDSKIREMMKIEKTENFSAFVIDLCWKGVEQYHQDKEIIKKASDPQRENEAIDE